jgi:hypothetical protein
VFFYSSVHNAVEYGNPIIFSFLIIVMLLQSNINVSCKNPFNKTPVIRCCTVHKVLPYILKSRLMNEYPVNDCRSRRYHVSMTNTWCRPMISSNICTVKMSVGDRVRVGAGCLRCAILLNDQILICLSPSSLFSAPTNLTHLSVNLSNTNA